MLKKWLDGTVKDVPRDGYLNINGKKHLVLNIKNQPIEVLNANNIFEYEETSKPSDCPGFYCVSNLTLVGNKILKQYKMQKMEEVLMD
jgi:hypothetical protein